MPLQNRVGPDGLIVARAARGTMMGNRGGRIHDADRTLRRRRWASNAWICCVTEFNNRKRTVMSPNSYTELFFLDEATAFAAGHRPCFECRRTDAIAFAVAWNEAVGDVGRAKVREMDLRLHRDRLMETGEQRVVDTALSDLPDGVMIRAKATALLLRGRVAFPWSFAGYGRPVSRETLPPIVTVLTPRATVEVIRAGYRVSVHETAGPLI